MKPIHNIALATAFAAALSVPAFAQTAPSQPVFGAAAQGQHTAHHHGGMMRLMRKLNLTSDQQQRIKTIVTSYRQSHPKGSTPDPQARASMRQQVMSVLTPQQQAQLKTEMQQSGGAENQRGNGMMRGFSQLNLNDQQKAQIQTIVSQYRQAHPQGSAQDPQARAAMHQQIMNVLTPQQQTQLQQMQQNQPNPPRG